MFYDFVWLLPLVSLNSFEYLTPPACIAKTVMGIVYLVRRLSRATQRRNVEKALQRTLHLRLS